MRRCAERKIFIMKRFCLAAMITALLAAAGVSVYAADFSWTVSDDIVKPEFWAKRDIDAEPGTYYDGKNFYLVCSTGEASSATRINKWKRYKGTSMDDLVELEESTLIGFERPHGDDRYWLSGLYVDEETGVWYTTVHDEYNYYSSDISAHERYILYATSDDMGATWTLRDVIISSYAPENSYSANSGRYVHFGVGDQKLYIDRENGYIYCYYMEAWTDKETNYMYKTYNVARSPIEADMAAGSWTKWYKGEWCEPGLGGYDTPLFSPPSTGVYVAYNTYLGKYMAIGMQKESNEAFISTCTDLEKNDWTLPEKFYSNKLLGWYNWGWDNETRSRDIVGKNFRFYTSSHTYGQLQYREVTLDNTKPSEPEFFYPNYSYLKGTTLDYNDMLDMTPGYAYRENFSYGTDGWEIKSGSAELQIEKQGKSLLVTNTGAGDAVLIDSDAPVLSEGRLDFTVALQGGERFGVLLGYKDSQSYVRLGYDTGIFTWELPDGRSGELFEARLLNETGQPYYISIEFKADKLKISIDENVMFDGSVPEIDGISGRYGMIVPEGEAVYFDDFAYYDGIKVLIDGVPIGFDVQPQNTDGRIVVPMRKIFELFGADVTYDEENAKITAVKGDKEIILTAGSAQALVNGEPVEIDVGVVIANGRALVPIRFISEQFGADVVWDSEIRKVEITSNGNLVIGLQQLAPYELKLKAAAAVGIVDYFDDYTTTHKSEGSFMYKKDVCEEYDMRGRIYRTYDGEPAARIYHLEETDISEIMLKIATQTETVSNHVKCYVSPDGEQWTELTMQSANSVKDASRANLYYADYYPKKCVPEGMRYFKVELLANGKNWSSQIGRVDINRSLLEAQDGILEEGQIYDRFRDLGNIYSLDGEVYTESDNRSEFNSVYRLYRKTPTLSSALTYLNTEDITTVAMTVYTKGTDTEKYFDVYMSQDGRIWDKVQMTASKCTEDPINAGMYFTELECEATSAANTYLKIVIKDGFETWANQIANVRINVKTE